MNNDICLLAKPIITETDTCENLFLGTLNYGFKAVVVRYFELLRYLGVEYNDSSNIQILNSSEFYELSTLHKTIINIFLKKIY